jgi:hypothetical protein
MQTISPGDMPFTVIVITPARVSVEKSTGVRVTFTDGVKSIAIDKAVMELSGYILAKTDRVEVWEGDRMVFAL